MYLVPVSGDDGHVALVFVFTQEEIDGMGKGRPMCLSASHLTEHLKSFDTVDLEKAEVLVTVESREKEEHGYLKDHNLTGFMEHIFRGEIAVSDEEGPHVCSAVD